MIEFIKNLLSKIDLKSAYPYMMVLCLFLYFDSRERENTDNVVKFVNAMQDSTSHKIDNMGRKFSQTSQIRYSDPKVFLSVKSSDQAVKDLQNEVKTLKNKMTDGSSITDFSNNIHIDVKTQNGKFSDKWVNIDNSIEDRSVVNIKNKYSVALVEDKGQFVVNVRNDNPYSTGIDSIKTFVKTPKPENKWNLGIGAGYDPITQRVYPSIGVYRNIIGF